MATITGFNVTINTMCEPHHKTCFLAYTYNVVWDESDTHEYEDFNVKAHLWGGGSFDHNSILTDMTDDVHAINRGTQMPVIRKISVRCKRLDAFWGDSIIVKLVMTPVADESIRYEALASTEMEQELATAFIEEPMEPKQPEVREHSAAA